MPDGLEGQNLTTSDHVELQSSLSALTKLGNRRSQRDEREPPKLFKLPGQSCESSWPILITPLLLEIIVPQVTSRTTLSTSASHSSSGSIPFSVLAVVPHLGKLSSQIKSNPHLDQTRKYRIAFNNSGRVRDSLINNFQLVSLAEPIPRSIWKKIIQDNFGEFEKLYASMDRGYC